MVKAFFTEPVKHVSKETFTLVDSDGKPIPAFVEQIGDGTWGLFPHQVFLHKGKKYIARIAAPLCDFADNCIQNDIVWSFTIANAAEKGAGNTSIPVGFYRKQPVTKNKLAKTIN